MDSNPFDNLDIIEPQFGDNETDGHRKLDYLIHKIFHQSEEGIELLKLWKESLIMNPVASPGMDMLTVGINQGMKDFIRLILVTIRRVENE